LSSTSGAVIHYTTDGTLPTATQGNVYAGPIVIEATSTLNAIASKSGFADSPVSVANYTILPRPIAAKPLMSPQGGVYTEPQLITLVSGTSGATIYYTTNGETPGTSNGTVYAGPLFIDQTTTLQAIASADGFTDSAVENQTFIIAPLPILAKPGFTVDGGTYHGERVVEIVAPPGVSIRYTLDGSTPSATYGVIFSTPIRVTSTTSLKAVAFQDGFKDSAVATQLYIILPPVTVVFEAEKLEIVPSGTPILLKKDSRASDDKYLELAATGIDDALILKVHNIVDGNYFIKLDWKSDKSRGIVQVKVDGNPVGSPLDQYSQNSLFRYTTVGMFSFTAGDHLIQFVVSGKKAASNSYKVTADKITLIGQ
jgi:hypothetical protein